MGKNKYKIFSFKEKLITGFKDYIYYLFVLYMSINQFL